MLIYTLFSKCIRLKMNNIKIIYFISLVVSRLLSDKINIVSDEAFYFETDCCQEIPRNCTSSLSNSSCINGSEIDMRSCSENCNVCNKSSGYCEMCQEEFFLVKNQFCVRCPNNCKSCSSEEVCDDCNHGFKGSACQEKCPIYCKPNSSCDQEHGYCSEGCKDGLSGHYCNISCDTKCKSCDRHGHMICSSCADTRYGQTCDEECSKTCYGGRCNASNGFCVDRCVNGYWGDTCKNKCSNHCVDNECYRQNGTCIHECFDNETHCLCSEKCNCNFNSSCSFCHEDLWTMCKHNCSYSCYMKMCIENRTECLEDCKNGLPNGTYCGKVPSENITNVDAVNPDTYKLEWVGLVIGIVMPTVVVIFVALKLRAYRDVKIHQNELAGALFVANQTEVVRTHRENLMEDLDDFITDNLILAIQDEGNTYYNTAALKRRKIQISKLAEYVCNKTAEDFIQEFQELPPYLIKPFEESQKESNLSKNRYRGIYPYDSTRVVLKEGISDNINASFIDGYNHWRAYIASLGPTIKFMGDMSPFWNMVWQEKSQKIVMLTNLIEGEVCKCDQYWPNVCCTATYGEINVTCESEHIFVNYIVRKFIIQKKLEKREVAQFHFTAWPDKSVPEDINGLIAFWNTVNNYRTNNNGPIVVHCSAGVGRTGTFIALDILANEGKAEGCVDIFACVRNLREQRVKMVQTVEQYEYLHHAVVHLFNV